MTAPFNIKSKELEAFASLVLSGLATDRDFDLWPNKSDIRAIKTDNSVKHYRGCVTPVELRKADITKPRQYRIKSSEETRDRSGDVISVAGWDFDNYKGNPAMFADHDASMEKLVANVVSWEKALKETPRALYEVAQFVDAGISRIADVCEGLWRTGFGHAVSVGFLALETVYPDDEDERTKLGLGRFGCFFKRQEKLETSFVGIPCHPAALGTKAFSNELVVDHRLEVARAVWELVKAKTISREAGVEFLKATDRRSARRIFPVQVIEARTAPIAAEKSTQTPADSSVSSSNENTGTSSGDGGAALLALEALTKRLDASEQREQAQLARIDALEQGLKHTKGVLSASALTTRANPAAFQAASEDAALLEQLGREAALL